MVKVKVVCSSFGSRELTVFFGTSAFWAGVSFYVVAGERVDCLNELCVACNVAREYIRALL